MKTTLLGLLALLPLCACAADSYQRVPLPSQSVEVSSPAVCRIYVMRMPQMAGAVRWVKVSDNENEIGVLGRDNYLCWERKPGRTVANLEYGPVLMTSNAGLIDLNCSAGEVYYYGLTIDTALNKPEVQVLSKEQAQEILRQQKPAPMHQ